MHDHDAPTGPASLEDLLDGLVAEFADRLAQDGRPDVASFLSRAPAQARPGLERCLKTLLATHQGASPLHRLRPGQRVGRYELVRELGRGGMALVFLATDTELGRTVALKVLRPGLALDRTHRDRFRREGQAMARVKHPNVVPVFEVGEDGELSYLAMEYVAGPSLETVVDALPRDRRPSAEDLALALGLQRYAGERKTFEGLCAELLGQVCAGLASAHDAGLIHRDIKPSNILIHADGRPVLADFGLARADGDAGLSFTGATVGTPHYMSPEQAHLSSATVDRRTDVYSLGVTLYELLSRRRPYTGESFLEVIEAIRSTVPPPLRQVDKRLSKDAEAVCRKAMQHDPEHRYATADELRVDLEALAEGLPVAAGAGGWWSEWRDARRSMSAGRLTEYRSSRSFLGIPLVHVVSGVRRSGAPRVAKGWLAMGPIAIGGLATGGMAMGGLAFGGLGLGLVTWAGLAAGGLAWGGVAAGGLACGGVAAGSEAMGGVAIGRVAVGGLAIGEYAMGGQARGTWVISREGGRRDPEAVAFFRDHVPARPFFGSMGLTETLMPEKDTEDTGD